MIEEIRERLVLAEAAESAGRIVEALAASQWVLEHDPASRPAQERIAIFTVADNPDRAVRLARNLGMHGGDREILAHLGYVSFRAWSHHRGRDQALSAIRCWLAIQPTDKDRLLEAGDYAAAVGEPTLAADVYAQAFAVQPGSLRVLQAWIGQLVRVGRPVEARERVEAIMRRAPGQAPLYLLLGQCCAALGEHRSAESAWQRAIDLAPQDIAPRSSLMYSLLCRDDIDASGLLNHARAFAAAARARPLPAGAEAWPPLASPPEAGRRLRIGLASADLNAHPVGFFMTQFFRHRNRDRFELVVLADSRADDFLAREFRASADAWHDMADIDAAEYARFVRGLSLDVLIDLSGHTGRNRLPEFAWRLARRQATYLGFAGTTGGPALDSRLADADTEPEGSENVSSEAIIRLEGSYFCFTPFSVAGEVLVSESPAAQGKPLTFGCFAQYAKISPTAIGLWVAVLRAIPDARIAVRCREFGEAAVHDDFVRRWVEQGGAAAQLQTDGWRLGGDHFRAYDDIDIVLNTFPFHLATNLCDALWMGVPIVSLLGTEHRSRMALSICRAAGYPEWCAADAADFVAKARALAGDVPRLAALRRELREQLCASPLFDGAGFARRLESALTKVSLSCAQPENR
jgi:protein O-GlcNAc transferase